MRTEDKGKTQVRRLEKKKIHTTDWAEGDGGGEGGKEEKKNI